MKVSRLSRDVKASAIRSPGSRESPVFVIDKALFHFNEGVGVGLRDLDISHAFPTSFRRSRPLARRRNRHRRKWFSGRRVQVIAVDYKRERYSPLRSLQNR